MVRGSPVAWQLRIWCWHCSGSGHCRGMGSIPGLRTSQATGVAKKKLKKRKFGVPIVTQQKIIQLGTMRLQDQSLVLLSGLRIRCCCELWCRSQTLLGSGVAVALAQVGSNSSHQTLSLGTSICHGSGPRKGKKDKKKKKKENMYR